MEKKNKENVEEMAGEKISNDDKSVSDVITEEMGQRKRKQVEVFEFEQKKDDFVVPKGRGMRLGDMPSLAEKIQRSGKKDDEILKALYMAMYSRRYAASRMKQVKADILEFTGLTYESTDEKARDTLLLKLSKWMLEFVKEIMDFLEIDRSMKSFEASQKSFHKENMILRIIEWLECPTIPPKKKAASTPKTKSKREDEIKPESKVIKKKSPKTSSKKSPMKKKKMSKKKLFSASANMLSKNKPENDNVETPKKKRKKMVHNPVSNNNNKKDAGSAEEFEKLAMEAEKNEVVSPQIASLKSISLDDTMKNRLSEIVKSADLAIATFSDIWSQVQKEFGELSTQKKQIKEYIKSLL